MMFGWLDKVEAESKEGFQVEALYSWDTPLSGRIDIRIDEQGRWWHEGGIVLRRKLVDLFISILRREGDEYFLVTPAEKWQIQVDDAPISIVDVSVVGRELFATLETGYDVIIGQKHPLSLNDASSALYLQLEHGLTAKFNRASYYRAIDLAGENHCLVSGDYQFELLK